MASMLLIGGVIAVAAMALRYRARFLRIFAALMGASVMSAMVFVPAANATGPQSPLYITNTNTTNVAGTLVKLTTTGGSGSGAVTFVAKGTGCVVNNAKSTLTSTGLTSCSVVATKAASGTFSAISSSAVVFTFTGKAQPALVISNKVHTALAGTTVALTTTGGTGTGAVSFAVTGTGCTYVAKKMSLTASTMTSCSVVATKAGSGLYGSVTSAAVVFTFIPAKFSIVNTVHAGTVGTPVTVVAEGGSLTGTVSYSVTGTGCAIVASTGVLTATQAGTCEVSATLKSGTKVLGSVSNVAFVFTTENPTVANPDVATLTSVTGAAGAQVNDTANGDANFIDQYFNNGDHWYVNYVGAGSTITLTWHVAGSNKLPLAKAPVTLLSNLNYSCSTGVLWSTTSLNSFPGCNSGTQGSLSGTTDANGNVTFTLTNNNVVAGSAPTNTTSAAGVQANESSTFPWTAMLLQVGTDTYTGDPATTINQGTDRVDFIIIPSSNSKVGTDNPTVAKPDVATLTNVTGAAGSQINDTANGDNYFINQYYNNGDHWYGYYINDGANVALTWHVTGSNGQALPNAPVTLLSNLSYSCAKNLTWAQSSLNVYAGCGSGAQGELAGTTDSSGNVTFSLTNTNTDTGTAPSDTTSTAGMESNEGPFSWTDMVLQVGSDTFTGDPTATVNQGTDRVDFIVIPSTPTSPQTSPTYSNPDVASLTSITGGVNSTPLDDTANGDQWFISSYYSAGDHWNFTYVKQGSQFTENWHVVDFKGNPVANTQVTLLTTFAGTSTGLSASGLTNGQLTGTTDSNGNVSFTLTDNDTTAATSPTDITAAGTALGLESSDPWARTALLIGAPVANGGQNPADGAIGSSTDVITAGSAAIKDVNQATDLVDIISVPSSYTPPASGPTYAKPDVATMTAISGVQNTAPLDDTANGDQWFITSYYSPGDHWNFSYVKAGATFTETWNVKGSNGQALANATVTLRTTFAGNSANWSASGIANGDITGTTDANGNVTFTIKNTDTSSGSTPGNLTDPGTALGLEGTNVWTRMVLIVGTPVGNAGLPAGDGAVGSATDVITAANASLSVVNQATDLVDVIVVP